MLLLTQKPTNQQTEAKSTSVAEVTLAHLPYTKRETGFPLNFSNQIPQLSLTMPKNTPLTMSEAKLRF